MGSMIEWEERARKYCELAGLDPDKSIGHGADPDERGFVSAIMLYSPQWMFVVPKLKDWEIMAKVMKEDD